MFRSNRMKNLVGVSAIGLGLSLAGPAVAAEFDDPVTHTLSGHADIYGGYSWLDGSALDNNNEDSEFFFAGGNLRVHIPLGETLSFQADLDVDDGFVKGSKSDSYGGGFAAGGHLSYRQPGHYLFGVFGGGGEVDPEDNDDGTGSAAPFYFVGVEGQWHTGPVTLYGQGGWVDSHHPTDFEILDEAWFVRGMARMFISDHTMLQGELAYADGEEDFDNGTDDVYVVQWGARLEHQFYEIGAMDGFLSAFAEYRGQYFHSDNNSDGGDNGTLTDHSFLVGLKIALNRPTLRTHYTDGAGLSLPNFSRMITEVVYAD